MIWEDGQITHVEILSKKGQTCRINPKTKLKVSQNGIPVQIKTLDDGILTFPTKAGQTYILTL